MSSTAGTYVRHTVAVAVFGVILFYVLLIQRKPFHEHFTDHAMLGKGHETEAERIFTETELKYGGKESDPLYLVILGHVFDVTKGNQHYGPGRSYHMFIGHDATRSFVTGEFEQYSVELSDVSSLSDVELQQLFSWKEFYDKTYRYVGRVVGRYFDETGKETSYYQLMIERAAKAEVTRDTTKYPSCNVEWKLEMGTRVWCTNRSGSGQERTWIGRPRRVIHEATEDGQSVQFCACVPEKVSDAMYVPFPGCEEIAESCIVPDQK